MACYLKTTKLFLIRGIKSSVREVNHEKVLKYSVHLKSLIQDINCNAVLGAGHKSMHSSL